MNWRENRYLKYILVIVLFLVLFFVRKGSNPVVYVRNLIRIHQLHNSIDEYNQSAQETQQKINDLKSSNQKLEKFAREKYHMHRDDEDVYLIDEDSL